MTSQTLRISALTLALLAASPALAQEATDDTATTTQATTQDNGTDWGWIGLLGLIGLAGLAGRRRNDATTTTRL
jgi:MYXO-CTERM domain-containing protein